MNRRAITRRRVLAATIGAAAAAAGTLPAPAAGAPSSPLAPREPRSGRPAGYAVTDHIRRYYRLARY